MIKFFGFIGIAMYFVVRIILRGLKIMLVHSERKMIVDQNQVPVAVHELNSNHQFKLPHLGPR
jgi:hypothetical protein